MAFGVRVAGLKAVLTGDPAAFKKALGDAESAARHAGQGMTGSFLKAQLGAEAILFAVRGLAKGMEALVKTPINFAISAVDAFATFEQGLLEIRTILSDTSSGESADDQMKRIGQTAKQMAIQFGKPVQDVLKGFYEALSSGATDATSATDILTASLKLARGGLTNTRTAVDAITTVLNAFQLSSKDAERVADQMFTTVKLGKTTTEELASGIGTIASQAALFGLSTEEMFGALAAMTKLGVKTDIALTNLRALLTDLSEEESEGAMLAKSMGLQWGIGALQAGQFTSMIQGVNYALSQQPTLVAKLFENVRSLGGASILASQGFRDFLGAIASVREEQGTATMASDTMATSMRNMLDSISVGWEVLKINLAEQFAPEIKAALQGIVDALTVLNQTEIPLAERLEAARAAIEEKTLPGLVKIWDRLVELWNENKAPLLQFFSDLGSDMGDALQKAIGMSFARLKHEIRRNLEELLAEFADFWTFGLASTIGEALAGGQVGRLVQGREGMDANVMRVTSGEFVLRREAVQAIGIDRVAELNRTGPTVNNAINLAQPPSLTRSDLHRYVIPELERAVETGRASGRRLGL